jgi:hypothetical protein
MEAVTSARAHAQVLETSLSKLANAVAMATPTLASEHASQLTRATSDLTAAGAAIDKAVFTAFAMTTLPKGSARGSASSAAEAVKTAEQRIAQAKTLILSLQQASTATGPAVKPAVNDAAAALADSEQAIRAAKIAVRTATDLLSRTRRKLQQAAAITLIPGGILLLLDWQVKPAQGQFGSLIFATVTIAIGLLVLVATSDETGLLGPIVGADNRVSTSKTQLGIWTVAIGWALAFLLGRVLWDGATLATVLPDERFNEYLVLLGGPFAAGVLAKAAVTWKTENGQLQKSIAPQASASQIVQDDNGNPSLVDAQYLLFNVVALGYFVVSLAQTQVLPTIPLVLFGLTSASAATYAANKLAQSNAPIITAVSPRSCLPGGRVRVSGSNFMSGADSTEVSQVAVLIDGYPNELHPVLTSDSSELVVDLPADLPAGTRGLTVTTTARVVSAPYLVDILENKPVLFGVQGVLRHGQTATAVGRNLLSPGSSATSEQVGVLVGGKNAVGTATADTVVFLVPSELPRNSDVQVTMTRAGGMASDPITVHVA